MRKYRLWFHRIRKAAGNLTLEGLDVVIMTSQKLWRHCYWTIFPKYWGGYSPPSPPPTGVLPAWDAQRPMEPANFKIFLRLVMQQYLCQKMDKFMCFGYLTILSSHLKVVLKVWKIKIYARKWTIVIFHILRTKTVSDYFWLKRIMPWTNDVPSGTGLVQSIMTFSQKCHEHFSPSWECGNNFFLSENSPHCETIWASTRKIHVFWLFGNFK